MRCLALMTSLALSTPALADVPKVVTDIAPVHSLVASVMGDLGTPDLILPADGDPHHFQLRPSQMRALDEADLVFWVGPALTPWLEDVLHSNASSGRVEVQLLDPAHLPMVIAGSVAMVSVEMEPHDDDMAEETHEGHNDGEHADTHDGDHDGGHAHDHGPIDPHIWLDPMNGAHFLTEIAEALSDLDPANAAIYSANAQATKARLITLTDRLTQDLRPLRHAVLIPYHDAYKYFFIRFDLDISGSLADTEAAAPSAARIREIRDMLATQTRPCLFREPGANDNLIASVLPSGHDAVISHLDGLGSTLTPGPTLYETLIEDMAKAIRACAPRP